MHRNIHVIFAVLIITACGSKETLNNKSQNLASSDNVVTYDEMKKVGYLPSQEKRQARILETGLAGGFRNECDGENSRMHNEQCIDEDNDGIPLKDDCDDSSDLISPAELDIECDGIDQNCNGFDECDSDNDGYDRKYDCDDTDKAIGCECHQWCKRGK